MVHLSHILAQVPPSWWPWPQRTRDIVGHWSDYFNCLDLIPGPPFLFWFIIYAAAVIVALRHLRGPLLELLEPGGMMTPGRRIPFSLKPSFLEIACLQGGRKAVLAAAASNLYRLRLITCTFNPGPASGPTLGTSSRTASLTALERSLCMAMDRHTDASQIGSDPDVRRELKNTVKAARQKLSVLGLTPTLLTWTIVLLLFAGGMLLVPGLAVVRLIRSDLRGYHNVGFLVVLLIVSLIVVPVVMLRRVYASGAGSRYLRRLQGEARPIIRRLQSHLDVAADDEQPARHGAEVIYALAACGEPALDGTAYHDLHRFMYPRPELNMSSWSSDSGSCSSCGGGSCGGGSCGGGGCGGGGCGGG